MYVLCTFWITPLILASKSKNEINLLQFSKEIESESLLLRFIDNSSPDFYCHPIYDLPVSCHLKVLRLFPLWRGTERTKSCQAELISGNSFLESHTLLGRWLAGWPSWFNYSNDFQSWIYNGPLAGLGSHVPYALVHPVLTLTGLTIGGRSRYHRFMWSDLPLWLFESVVNGWLHA